MFIHLARNASIQNTIKNTILLPNRQEKDNSYCCMPKTVITSFRQPVIYKENPNIGAVELDFLSYIELYGDDHNSCGSMHVVDQWINTVNLEYRERLFYALRTCTTVILTDVSFLADGPLLRQLDFLLRYIKKNNILFGGTHISIIGNLLWYTPDYNDKVWNKTTTILTSTAVIGRNMENQANNQHSIDADYFMKLHTSSIHNLPAIPVWDDKKATIHPKMVVFPSVYNVEHYHQKMIQDDESKWHFFSPECAMVRNTSKRLATEKMATTLCSAGIATSLPLKQGCRVVITRKTKALSVCRPAWRHTGTVMNIRRGEDIQIIVRMDANNQMKTIKPVIHKIQTNSGVWIQVKVFPLSLCHAICISDYVFYPFHRLVLDPMHTSYALLYKVLQMSDNISILYKTDQLTNQLRPDCATQHFLQQFIKV
jgi:hypothetical protein